MQVRKKKKTVGYKDTEYEDKSLDEITVGIARLSSSRETNELFNEADKLLKHCILNGHWSIFNTTNLVFEIETSRAVARQLLRHWSLKPQEFSARYAEVVSFEDVEIRKQCTNNRQSSEDVFNPDIKVDEYFSTDANAVVADILDETKKRYSMLLDTGCSRETSRMILPECATTKIIFNGTLREWITTLNQRLHKTAQKETRLVCEAIRDYFIIECPIISKSLFNFEDAYDIHLLDKLVLEKYNVFTLVKNNNFLKLK